jgi:hypothetical protein
VALTAVTVNRHLAFVAGAVPIQGIIAVLLGSTPSTLHALRVNCCPGGTV